MKLFKTGMMFINLEHMSYAEKSADGSILVHLIAPLASVVPGIKYATDQPGASDHCRIKIPAGPNADALSKLLDDLISQQ